jgi:hypothetical protein
MDVDARPLVIPPPTQNRDLARASGAFALGLARRAVVGLVRREPGAVLTFGFGAGLIARAALGSLLRSTISKPAPLASRASTEIVDMRVETLTVQTVRFLRRTS